MGPCASKQKEEEREISYLLTEPDTRMHVDRVRPQICNVRDAACIAMRGWRSSMEDVSYMSTKQSPCIFGVFDGHSGAQAANYAHKHLVNNIMADIGDSFNSSFKEACTSGFLKTDREMRGQAFRSGSTAVMAFVTSTHVHIANCGDSRCIMSKGGKSMALSIDHKPHRKAERRRVLRAGGFIDDRDPTISRIICPTTRYALAVSRALGDFEYKNQAHRGEREQIVSPVPECHTHVREGDEEFLLLASDGIWDVLDNRTTVKLIHKCLEAGIDRVDLIGQKILEECLMRGSSDNMTIVIADLRDLPPPSTPVTVDLEPDDIAKARSVAITTGHGVKTKRDAASASASAFANPTDSSALPPASQTAAAGKEGIPPSFEGDGTIVLAEDPDQLHAMAAGANGDNGSDDGKETEDSMVELGEVESISAPITPIHGPVKCPPRDPTEIQIEI